MSYEYPLPKSLRVSMRGRVRNPPLREACSDTLSSSTSWLGTPSMPEAGSPPATRKDVSPLKGAEWRACPPTFQPPIDDVNLQADRARPVPTKVPTPKPPPQSVR